MTPVSWQITDLFALDIIIKDGEPDWEFSVSGPMRSWLLERDESPVVDCVGNRARLNFKSPTNAMLFKLMWVGV